MLRNQPGIIDRYFARDRRQLGSLEELGRSIVASSAQLLSDLARPAFFLEKLLASFFRASLGFGRTRRIEQNCINNLRRANQSLLIQREQFEQGTISRDSCQKRDRFIGGGAITYDGFMNVTIRIRARRQITKHRRRGVFGFCNAQQIVRLLTFKRGLCRARNFRIVIRT